MKSIYYITYIKQNLLTEMKIKLQCDDYRYPHL